MGHGKPPPRRCGKGYRTGRYSKPIVAPRARGKKLRRGGGGPNGFLISSFLKGCFMNELPVFPDKPRRRQEKNDRSDERARVQQSIARGYDDLVSGRMRSWKQAKAEADRMRAINRPSPM